MRRHHRPRRSPLVWLLLCAALFLAVPASADFELAGADCLDCHAELNEKKVVHSIMADSASCTMCHQQDNPGLHGFTPFGADVGNGVCAMCHGEFPGSRQPHFPVETGDCLACHDPHQSDLTALLTRPQGELCFDCHAPFAGRKKAHDPVATGSCSACHNPHRADQPSLLRAAEPDLCFTCHAPFEGGGSSHMPVAYGGCSTCHLPHVADTKSLLNAPQAELCLQCHEPFRGAVVHGPVRDGNCAGCHDPHQSAQKALLRNAGSQLCLGCHDKRLTDGSGVALENIAALVNDDKVRPHPPFAYGDCTDCHRPHAGEHVRLLTESYPAGGYAAYSEAAYALCFQCHDAGAFAALRTREATAFRNGELNLHYRHVNRDKGRVCGHCHSPHGSIQPALIKPYLRFGKREMTQFFTVTETGGSCQTACHTKVSYDRNEAVDNRLRVSPWK